jgi:hypothetical protein
MSEGEYFTDDELEEIHNSYQELKGKLEELLIDNEDVAGTFFDGDIDLANKKIEKLLDFLDEIIAEATGMEEVEETETEETEDGDEETDEDDEDEDEDKKKE